MWIHTVSSSKTCVLELEQIVKIPNKIIVSVLIKREDKYLFIKEKKANTIHFISGNLESEQTPEESIRKEVLEEVNLTLSTIIPFDFDSDITDYKRRETQLIFLRYTAEVENISSAKSNSDAKELVWLSKEELKKFQHDEPSIRFFKKLKLL